MFTDSSCSALGSLNIPLAVSLLSVENSNATFDRVTYGHSVKFLEGDNQTDD